MSSHVDTIRELAINVPGATKLFDEIGIDYCGRSDLALQEVCSTSGIDIYQVLASLETLEAAARRDPLSPSVIPPTLAHLIDHLVATYHANARYTLEHLGALAEEAVGTAGGAFPQLARVRKLVRDLACELRSHMFAEERVLFPYIIRLENASNHGSVVAREAFGSVCTPISAMKDDHDSVAEILRRLNEATGGYKAPGGANEAVRELYAELADFECDLRYHMHLENNVLFPRAEALEALL
jgi:regulator of cell morphogenesis and NO signaling